MKKTETLLMGGAGLIIAAALGIWIVRAQTGAGDTAPTLAATKYGAFLAAQHAVYVNDFDRAADLMRDVPVPDVVSITAVTNTHILADFLSGRIPQNTELLADEKSMSARLVYDAHLIGADDWATLYERHKKDSSALTAPLRIWATVATGKTKEALAFVKTLDTNASWTAFVRGQIYATMDQPDKAALEFAQVRPEFMNINDYLYLMSFYTHFDRPAAAENLRAEFSKRPGSMFMLAYDTVPDWETYAGIKNALAFSLIQNVSHTQIMMYTDLALLLLRFAEMTHTGAGNITDAVNYYIGQYFYTNTGNYRQFFTRVGVASPYAPFAALRLAEGSGDPDALARVAAAHPLFVPAISKQVASRVSQGDRRGALRTLNRALAAKNLTDIGRAFFLKSRAGVYLVFGDLDAAQNDIHAAAEFLPADPEIVSLQAKIWAAQNRELDDANDYAMTLVRKNPTDIVAWDTLAAVVAVREGVTPALELLERVGGVAVTCSSLFERLGDLYVATGDARRARDAYLRAIDLAEDGLSSIPAIEKKLRKLK